MRIFISLICGVAIYLSVLASPVRAEGFPESYISRGLVEAHKGLTIDVARLGEGEMLSVQYLGRPVYVYRRRSSDIARLQDQSGRELKDPRNEAFMESVRQEFSSTSATVWTRLLLAGRSVAMATPTRSRDKAILVIAGWAPGSGCLLALASPRDRAEAGVVFRDPCTGATFDAAGRVFSRTVAVGSHSLSFNAAIPPYQIDRHRIVIGPELRRELPPIPFSRAELCPVDSPTQNLICAARYNDMKSVRDAIDAGADVNYFRPGEGSPINASIAGSSLEIIRLLLQNGARPTHSSEMTAQFVHREDVLAVLHGEK